MGAQTTAMFAVETIEATQDAGVKNARPRARCPTSMEVQRQWARTLVECRGQTYDCRFTAKVLHSTRAGLAGGKRIGQDVSEKLDYTPGLFTVERHIRGKWAYVK